MGLAKLISKNFKISRGHLPSLPSTLKYDGEAWEDTGKVFLILFADSPIAESILCLSLSVIRDWWQNVGWCGTDLMDIAVIVTIFSYDSVYFPCPCDSMFDAYLVSYADKERSRGS